MNTVRVVYKSLETIWYDNHQKELKKSEKYKQYASKQ